MTFRKSIFAVVATVLLAQGTQTFAQSNPLDGIYSDAWMREELRLDPSLSSFGDAAAGRSTLCFFGSFAVIASGGFFLRKKVIPKISAPLIWGATALTSGLASYACGSMKHRRDLNQRVEEHYESFLRSPLTERMTLKLNRDLTSRFKLAEKSKLAAQSPIQERIFIRGASEVEKDLDRVIRLVRDKAPMDEILRHAPYLLGASERELIRAIYAVKRADDAGRPLSSISIQSIKRLAAAPVTDTHKPEASTAGAAQ